MRKAAEHMARYWQWFLHDIGPRWNDQLTQMGKDACEQKGTERLGYWISDTASD